MFIFLNFLGVKKCKGEFISDKCLKFACFSLDKQVGGIENAHDGIIWDVKWHPLGHIVASASNDFATKFWTRNNPGDRMRDKYNLKLDEELETEELMANLEPDPRAVQHDQDIGAYMCVLLLLYVICYHVTQ